MNQAAKTPTGHGYSSSQTISSFDSELWDAMTLETQRQEEHIELIASENYASPRVLEAQGSVLTNKYAEGYPGKRYYGGCEFVDRAEVLAIERAKELFGAAYANVQPHSGSSANIAVFHALLQPGDTVMGMSLADGGHLTHGAGVNFSGKIYNAVQYGIDNTTGEVDYDELMKIALEHKPKLIIGGFSAYSRIMDWSKFREIADAVGAYLLVDMAHVAGLVAAGVYPNPIPHADVVTTTTHKTLRGPRSGLILARENEELHKKLNSAIFRCSGWSADARHRCESSCFQRGDGSCVCRLSTSGRSQCESNGRDIYKPWLQSGSGGTDNHLMLLDLRDKEYTGKERTLRWSSLHHRE